MLCRQLQRVQVLVDYLETRLPYLDQSELDLDELYGEPVQLHHNLTKDYDRLPNIH